MQKKALSTKRPHSGRRGVVEVGVRVCHQRAVRDEIVGRLEVHWDGRVVNFVGGVGVVRIDVEHGAGWGGLPALQRVRS